MKRLLKNITICSLGTVICLQSLAFPAGHQLAQTTVPPKPVNLTSLQTQDTIKLLRTCNLTLDACAVANADKQSVIDTQGKLITLQDKQISKLESENHGLFHSPTFWFVVGVLTTGTVVYLTK